MCSALWSGKPVSHAGQHFTFDVTLSPAPRKPPPIWLAGVGATPPNAGWPGGRRLAAVPPDAEQYAEGWRQQRSAVGDH